MIIKKQTWQRSPNTDKGNTWGLHIVVAVTPKDAASKKIRMLLFCKLKNHWSDEKETDMAMGLKFKNMGLKFKNMWSDQFIFIYPKIPTLWGPCIPLFCSFKGQCSTLFWLTFFGASLSNSCTKAFDKHFGISKVYFYFLPQIPFVLINSLLVTQKEARHTTFTHKWHRLIFYSIKSVITVPTKENYEYSTGLFRHVS